MEDRIYYTVKDRRINGKRVLRTDYYTVTPSWIVEYCLRGFGLDREVTIIHSRGTKHFYTDVTHEKFLELGATDFRAWLLEQITR